MPNDKYAAERGDPPAPQCGTYTLLFDAYYLKLHQAGKVIRAWHARSGKKKAGLFDYSLAHQKVGGQGPIPEGAYWIQPEELDTFFWGSESGWGTARITIHPRPKTITHGRGGFFVHGGAAFGSAGCIDLAYGMESFAPILSNTIAPPLGPWYARQVNRCHVPLTVKYSVLSLGDP